MMKKWSVAFVLSFLCLAISLPVLHSQTTTTGSVVGVVTDQNGAVVPNAAITLKDLGRGSSQDTTTNKDGFYRFDLVLPGNYSVTVVMAGFQSQTRQLSVVVSQVSGGDFSLKLARATAAIEITAQTPLLQTDTGNVTTSLNESQAQNIPNPGNDITYIAQIAPGATMNTGGGGYGNFSVNGLSPVSNLFTLNGMVDNDPFLNLNNSGATNQMLGQNEIQEVSVVANGYSAEYGGLSGANINYVTKGGTNDFHGRATWYWNGRALNANSWFNNATGTPRSFVNANQYGGEIGGPVVKNKLFFYFDAEGLYLLIPTSALAIVPSSQFESAVTANIASLGDTAQEAFYKTIFKLYNAAPGASHAVNNLPDDGCDGSEYFINQNIDTESEGESTGGFGAHDATLNPFGADVPCALSFRSTAGNKTHDNIQAGRVDWNITNNDRLFVRVQHELGLQATFTDPINAVFNAQSVQPEKQAQLQEVHTFGSGAVNQLVIASQWYSAIFNNASPSATLSAFPTTLQMASGQLSNLGGIDLNWPEGRNVTQFQASDDFSKEFGSHTLKFGYTYLRYWVTNADYGILENGWEIPITLDGLYSGSVDPSYPYGIGCPPSYGTPPGPAALCMPNFAEAYQTFPQFSEARFALYHTGGYIEDDWKPTRKLTLTLGFRLDHASNPICFTNCFVLASTEFPSLSASPDTAYNTLLNVGQRRLLPDLTAFEPQPRLGFAWQVMRNTVVRGGVGLFYDNYPGLALDGTSENGTNDPLFVVAFSEIAPASDSNSLLATAAAANATFQSMFKSGGTYDTMSAANPFFVGPSLTVSVNSPKVMQVQKWSLQVEHQFGTNTSFDLQYVGNHGIHILFQNPGINGCGFGTLPDCNETTKNSVNPNFGEVIYNQNGGVSSYNGLTASFTHRYGSGQVQVNYTYSHALDDVSNSGILPYASTGFGATNGSILNPEDPANPAKYNYASSDDDVRHTLNLNYVWELPIKRFITFGHGPDRLLKGWTVEGAMFLRSGFPLTATDLATSTGLNSSSSYYATVFGNHGTGGTSVNCASLHADEPNTDICFKASDFTTSSGTWGNVQRNSFRGPAYWDTDFALMKRVQIWERAELNFGVQFFNVFNHPNFDSPIMNTSDPKFGLTERTVSPPTTMYGSVLGADASPRLVQLKLQVAF